MKQLIFALALAAAAAAQDAHFAFDQPTSTEALLPVPEGVTVAWDNGALKVTATEPETSVALLRVPMDGVTNPYVYQARVKSEGLTAPAYLELWSEFDSGKYFSRALDQALNGDSEWQGTQTPLFLQPNDPQPKSVTLGLRFEGTGAVWIDDIALGPMGVLTQAASTQVANSAGGILGALFGIIVGTWGAATGYFAPRGKGRRLLLGIGYAIVAFSVITLIVGIGITVQRSMAHAYPFLLIGILGTVLEPILIGVVQTRYRDAELRQIQAMDTA